MVKGAGMIRQSSSWWRVSYPGLLPHCLGLIHGHERTTSDRRRKPYAFLAFISSDVVTFNDIVLSSPHKKCQDYY